MAKASRLMHPDALRRPLRGLTPQEWEARYVRDVVCASQLVLEYLPCHEFSVDCLGDAGRSVTGMVRKKSIITPNCRPTRRHWCGTFSSAGWYPIQ
jgi:hypothetical protein